MFRKVLIANRGAIATRIIRTLRRLGVESVAVYAEADAQSLHVLQADHAYSLGAGNAGETYLHQARLLAAIEASGAEAVHPGYGFLSETPAFVAACEQLGVVFLGPTQAQMAAFGLKHSARRLAEENQAPLLPGSDLLRSPDEALAAAASIGYPVMLKATAGGGGIGMRLCRDVAELGPAFDAVRRLGAGHFANQGVFLERFVEHARHIEVQAFGDGAGQVITLGERDCSSQRRNQKVIEETPAPQLPESLRRELGEVAARLLRAVNYRGVGTVEFVYDPARARCYFLEVNTRLQVEHGVTEQVYGIDLVEWMLRLGCGELSGNRWRDLEASLKPAGHAIQARIYAEDPGKDFQPCAGLLSQVALPQSAGRELRVDHWIETGLEVSPWFDPLLAKVIAWGNDRAQALDRLQAALAATQIHGIETNVAYLQQALATATFARGAADTGFLRRFAYRPATLDVLAAGAMTTIQDFPGRIGYWDVGVPPSGPFDDWSFRLGNRLLGNPPQAPGLEITLHGPTLRCNCPSRIVLTGAAMDASVDGEELPFWTVRDLPAGAVVKIGKPLGAGARAYLLFLGGLDCPRYLGSAATFTLGQFGGHGGRALRGGDVLRLARTSELERGQTAMQPPPALLPATLLPVIGHDWELRVLYGPQGAPDFFTEADMARFFAARWEVHYHSSRTGVRLLGPQPEWARSDGGEAGMHPSNIHDNAYAIGAVDFTGDMPVILGPDGPSLGGFVCPVTLIKADLWKLGQLKAGDRLRFVPVSHDSAVALLRAQEQSLQSLTPVPVEVTPAAPVTPLLKTLAATPARPRVVYRRAGDDNLLVEYGPLALDINLRFRVHALLLYLRELHLAGVLELTPGVRSLQVRYDSLVLPLRTLMEVLEQAEQELAGVEELPARLVHLPLSWDDEACQTAIDKYMQSVRGDAPWCPSNLEFIRRINGLESISKVKNILFEANYLVLGLGDVYLGAPVATPLDPRHRLVTTKYNPARTWTAENSVGIGGSYLCVYGMEGPGGYQLVGRTLQMWNRYRQTAEFEQPWLLRFFDQIRFYEVSHAELTRIRQDFPHGKYPLRIEPIRFSLPDYNAFLDQHRRSIGAFTVRRQAAFEQERQRWVAAGQMSFDSQTSVVEQEPGEPALAEDCLAVESHVSGNLWRVSVRVGERVTAGQTLAIVEAMKMELEIHAPEDGVVRSITRRPGSPVTAGQRILVLAQESPPACSSSSNPEITTETNINR